MRYMRMVYDVKTPVITSRNHAVRRAQTVRYYASAGLIRGTLVG